MELQHRSNADCVDLKIRKHAGHVNSSDEITAVMQPASVLSLNLNSELQGM